MKNFVLIALAIFSLTGCAFLNQFNPFYSETQNEQETAVTEEAQIKKEAPQIHNKQTEKQTEKQHINLQGMQNPKNNPAMRTYSGFSKAQLEQAIKNVLYLMDTKNAKIEQQENAVINYRSYTDRINTQYISGCDTWVVTIDEQKNNTFALSVMVGTAQEVTASPNSFLQPKTPDELYFPINALDEAQSMLFFERLDYFLGKNPNWRSCENIQNWVKENKYKGKFQDTALTNSSDLPFICGHNWYGIEDKSPDFLDTNK